MALGLTIDSQSLDIEGAWKHNRSLRRLRSTLRTRGENRIIPDAAGRLAFPGMRDETIVDLELMVSGLVDSTGTPHANREVGLDDNLAFLEDFVAAHTDGSAATYTASLETRSARTFEAEVQILNWQIMRDNAVQVVVSYDLRVPSGLWTETTP